MTLDFRVLGSCDVLRNGRPVDLGGAKQTALLAALLLRANQIVPIDDLIGVLWDGSPPRTSRATVHSHVRRLRRTLGSDASQGFLHTCPGGYRLAVAADQLDILRFDELVEAAQHAVAAGELDDAATRLREAVSLWRGPALQDIASPLLLRTAVPALEERRLSTAELAVDVDLRRGRHTELIPELEALVRAHRARERFHELLMLAYHRSGRAADALAVFRRCERWLVQEYGLEPSVRMRRLEAGIRDGTVHSGLRRAVGTPTCQLPPVLADFTGRDDVVDRVVGLLSAEQPETAGVVIVGQPGIGKTAVAVRAGAELAERFPDGQIFVDLQGAQGRTLEPARVLEQFLRSLGILNIPEGTDQRGQLYRSLAADRRLLVVLDNAADEAQVRPLLPGSPGCATIVTARHPLPGLEATQVVHLDLLTEPEAVELLGKIVDVERVSAETDAATRIVRLCGLLPLAVRVAGARLAAKPHWNLARLAAALADERSRLDQLVAGDLEVRASLALSYAGLTDSERAALRWCGLLRAVDFAAWPVAAVLGVDERAASGMLERLVDRQLLRASREDQAGQIRYHFHDLTRVFARERLAAQEPPAACRRAERRLLSACGELAGEACRRIERGDCHRDGLATGRPAERRYPHATAGIAADPYGWLTAEQAFLVTAVEHAVDVALVASGWQLAKALAPFFETRTHWDDWRSTHERCLAAARNAGERGGEAAMLCGLGQLALDRGCDEEAVVHMHAAADLAEVVGDDLLRGYALRGLGDAHRGHGAQRAIGYYTDALAVTVPLDDHAGQIRALIGLGNLYRRLGRLAEARETVERALGVVTGCGGHPEQPWVLSFLGAAWLDSGQPHEAASLFQRSIDAARALGDTRARMAATRGLADARRATGDLLAARELLERVCEEERSLGEQVAEVRALRRLGQVCGELDDGQLAERYLRRALYLAREVGNREVEAETLLALGEECQRVGRLADAADALDASLVIFPGVGLPQGEAAARRLLGAVRAALAGGGRSAM